MSKSASSVQVNDHVRVPKGTTVWENYWTEPTATKRDSVVQVSTIADMSDRWEHFLTRAEKDELQAARNKARVAIVERRQRDGAHAIFFGTADLDALCVSTIAKLRKAVEERHGNLLAVCWSSGRKFAFENAVEKVEAPAPKAKKEPTTTKKQQMVKGSKWKATKDVTINAWVPNPAYGACYDSKLVGEARRALFASVESRLNSPLCDVKAGAEFTVTEKMSNDSLPYSGDKAKSNGTMVTVSVDASMVTMHVAPYSWRGGWRHSTKDGVLTLEIPYKAFEPVVEASAIPEVFTYVLRDSATGQYFKALPDYTRRWNHLTQCYEETDHTEVEMTDVHSKGKQFDNPSRAKVFIMGFTGYYDGLPGAENLPEWMGGCKIMDLPATYELVKFDKLARKELEVLDVQKWHDRLWKLRPLTVKFGSSVRSVYSDIEKRDEIDQWLGMIVFTKRDENYRDWDGRSYVTKNEEAEIKALLKEADVSPKDVIKGKDANSMAISVRDLATAIRLRLAYEGSLEIGVINLEEMTEVVQFENGSLATG